MLELGRTRRQKWSIVGALTLLHVLSLGSIVGIFVVVGSVRLPLLAATLLVIGTVSWLFTFVLLFVNIAYLYLKRD